MPELFCIDDFVKATICDIHSPLTSQYATRIQTSRKVVDVLEEALEHDRNGLNKIRKSVKAIHNSGMSHITNETNFIMLLDLLGTNAMDEDEESGLGPSMTKFSVVFRDLTTLLKNLMQNLKNTVMYPLDTFLKSEMKGDFRKPFDRALKDYENKFEKIRKEKLQAAKEAGLPKTEVTNGEVCEDLERERRLVQLQLCEYLIHVNDFKVKKGADFIQNLVDYYSAQVLFFRESLNTLEHFGCFMSHLKDTVAQIRGHHDVERRKLADLREELKALLVDKECTPEPRTPKRQPQTVNNTTGYSLHQQQGNAAHGNVKSGYLYKKSDSKVKRLWQKRRVCCRDGCLSLYHADDQKPPVQLPLLTCQVKRLQEDRRIFHLISNNRTYQLSTDSEVEAEEWISVINNAKSAVFEAAIQQDVNVDATTAEYCFNLTNGSGDHVNDSNSPIVSSNRLSSGSLVTTAGQVAKQRRGILASICELEGNEVCADCDAARPQWLSVNLGVVICLECCGLHRQLGVHQSRTQSLTMDELPSCQLLQARFIGNKRFNRVFEATLPDGVKPSRCGEGEEKRAMDRRREFIWAKYAERRYVCRTTTDEVSDLRQDLVASVRRLDQDGLLQAFGEGADLLQSLSANMADGYAGETVLHSLLRQHDEQTPFVLPIADFLMQNGTAVELRQCAALSGESVLHYCARYNRPQSLKLVLRYAASEIVHIRNGAGQTAEELAVKLGHRLCGQLLRLHGGSNSSLVMVMPPTTPLNDDGYSSEEVVLRGPHTRFEHISMDWCLSGVGSSPECGGDVGEEQQQQQEMSDDDVEEKQKVGGATRQLDSRRLERNCSDVSDVSRSSLEQNSCGVNLAAAMLTLPRKAKARAPAPPSSDSCGIMQASLHGQHAFFTSPLSTPHRVEPYHLAAGAARKTMLHANRCPTLREARSIDNIDVIIDLLAEEPGKAVANKDKIAAAAAASSYAPTVPSAAYSTQTLPMPHHHRRGNARSSNNVDFNGHHQLGTAEVDKLNRVQFCKALYDCEADSFDELTFKEGEVIRVLRIENEDWWQGEIDGKPIRRGLFPVSYVHLIP